MAEIRDIKFGRSNERPRDATPRRLAAIVAGDISGYSRLMELDEEGTHARVKRIERDLIEPSIAEHHGRLVKTTGDGFIAIFDSPVEAVRFGIVIQQNMVGRNALLPKHHRIEYRIGVNLGDVIIEADDIYGDGVNIASRLEGIADPAASCPASCMFPPSLGGVSGLPLPRSLSPEPASESSGCPLVSVLRLCRRWMFELPRTPHAFGGAGFSQVPSCPVACFPPASPLM